MNFHVSILAVSAVLVAWITPAFTAPSPAAMSRHRPDVLRAHTARLRPIIAVAAVYCFRGSTDQEHRRWVCFIASGKYDHDRVLLRELKKNGIKVGTQIKNYPETGSFRYVWINSVKMLSSRRARVSINIDSDLDHEASGQTIVAENFGTLFLKKTGNEWVVDSRNSIIMSGD